jgi:CheY-like chemotaxis protein
MEDRTHRPAFGEASIVREQKGTKGTKIVWRDRLTGLLLMMEHGPGILMIGETSAVEMRGVVDGVLSCFPESEIRLEPLLCESEDAASVWIPSLVVVCQTWPDEFSQADVLRLFARFPLARWVCCCGLWCESDGRNRDAWPIGVRVPARNALGRLQHERDVLRQRSAALPLTAGRDEAFEFDGWCPAGWSSSVSLSAVRATAVERTTGSLKAGHQRTAAVLSPDRELRRCFEDRLGRLDWVIQTSDADCLLIDADPWNADSADALRRLRDRHPDAAVVALMNFAPPEDVGHVIRSGADGVVPKLIDDRALAAAFTSALDTPRPSGSES